MFTLCSDVTLIEGFVCKKRYLNFRCWVRLSPFVLLPQMGPFYQPLMADEYRELMKKITDWGKQRKICPSSTLLITNLTWT
jgi:hypothetical protein